jgi:hypothetical protein
LRAALLQSAEASEAWDRWQGQVDLDRLDYGSFRLLPLLYHNLRHQKIEHPWMGKFKGIYRRTWYENQIRFRNAAAILQSLHAAGIETLLLKGAALVLLHYRDLALRPMQDLDFLVPVPMAVKAEAVLQKLGWLSDFRPSSVECFLSFKHGAQFQHPDDGNLDLHWHVLNRIYNSGGDDEFWEGRVPAELFGVSTAALNPADQLLHVCAHGAAYDAVPPLRWVADAVVILRTSALDWDRCLFQARRCRLTLPLYETLRYLHYNSLTDQVPEMVLKDLHGRPVSRVERRVFESLNSLSTKQGPFLLAWFYYHSFAGLLCTPQGWHTLKAVMQVYQRKRRLGSLWKVPFNVALRWTRKIGQGFLNRYRRRLV